MDWIVIILAVLVGGAYFIWKLNKVVHKPDCIWNIALFSIPRAQNLLETNFSHPSRIFSPKAIRTHFRHTHTYADPFLFTYNNFLYLFYEQADNVSPGFIAAKRTRDLKKWENLGPVLIEPHHLSYPNIFEWDGAIYMIPESSETQSITLYRAEHFPFNWKKVSTLLDGHRFADSDIFHRDGRWYLFTTLWRDEKLPGLYLYTSDSLLGPYLPHVSSPLSTDFASLRCGGSLFEYEGNLYRPAQKCDNYYGEMLLYTASPPLSSARKRALRKAAGICP